jgi:hypothetical protein
MEVEMEVEAQAERLSPPPQLWAEAVEQALQI